MTFWTNRRWLLSAAGAGLLACSGGSDYGPPPMAMAREAPADYGGAYSGEEYDEAEAYAPMPMAIADVESAPAAAPSRMASRGSPASGPASKPPPPVPPVAGKPKQPVPEPRQRRMVHYNGFAKIRTVLPEDAVKKATKICDDAGGYVENLAGLTVTLRVPVVEFQRLFDALLELGTVISQSSTAQDVTESYNEVGLRLKTLQASRDRLIEVLAKTKHENEKLQLLREIRRLTEAIDQLKMKLKTIKGLADFSRITLTFIAHQPNTGGVGAEPIGAFKWLHLLSPFRRDVAHQGAYLELPAPEGMVAIEDREHWLAESADGAVVWTSERRNDPQGDPAFWIEAIRFRWEPQYKEAQVSAVGDYHVLRLVDVEGYRYLVAVRTDGDVLHLVEIYFPTEGHETRHGNSVEAALAGGVS